MTLPVLEHELSQSVVAEYPDVPPASLKRPVSLALVLEFVAMVSTLTKGLRNDHGERFDKHALRIAKAEARLKRVEKSYLGVWRSDRGYVNGDMTTHDGSLWICEGDQVTTQPGKGGDGWRLAVKRGNDGKPGPKGDVGPMPKHRWVDDTKLQFQQGPDGNEWGKPVDLKGPPGDAGRTVYAGGGGGTTTVVANSYWPSGW